jgi:hypothetical protein
MLRRRIHRQERSGRFSAVSLSPPNSFVIIYPSILLLYHIFLKSESLILAGLGLTESTGIWGRFTGWLRIVRTKYPSIWVTKQVVLEEFHRFLPKLKHLRVFGNIIGSMRTDAFLYKAA